MLQVIDCLTLVDDQIWEGEFRIQVFELKKMVGKFEYVCKVRFIQLVQRSIKSIYREIYIKGWFVFIIAILVFHSSPFLSSVCCKKGFLEGVLLFNSFKTIVSKLQLPNYILFPLFLVYLDAWIF